MAAKSIDVHTLPPGTVLQRSRELWVVMMGMDGKIVEPVSGGGWLTMPELAARVGRARWTTANTKILFRPTRKAKGR